MNAPAQEGSTSIPVEELLVDKRIGVQDTVWDNLGMGWRMHCICGWVTVPCDHLVEAAEEMEIHWDGHHGRR